MAVSGRESNFKLSMTSWVVGLEMNNSQYSFQLGCILFFHLAVLHQSKVADILCLRLLKLWIQKYCKWKEPTLGFGFSLCLGSLGFWSGTERLLPSIYRPCCWQRWGLSRSMRLSPPQPRTSSGPIRCLKSFSSSEDNQSSDHGTHSI